MLPQIENKNTLLKNKQSFSYNQVRISNGSIEFSNPHHRSRFHLKLPIHPIQIPIKLNPSLNPILNLSRRKGNKELNKETTEKLMGKSRQCLTAAN